MESMRDIDRTMEREVAKGSYPLRLVKIEFSDSPYWEIVSRGKLLEVLSYLLRTGDYGRFVRRGTGNNIYMDMKNREATFKRTRSFIDRNNIFSAIRRYGKKIEPDLNRYTYLETVRYCFKLPKGEQEKYQVTYNGQETFVLPMSNKYILGLYVYCISAKRAVPGDADIPSTGSSEEERGIASPEGVHGVLFQCLLFDTIKYGEDVLYANPHATCCLK